MSARFDRAPAASLKRNDLPTMGTLVRRIIATYGRATPTDVERGLGWYSDAGEDAETLGRLAGRDAEMGAAVLAHLSPRTPWARNVAGAYALVADGRAPGCLRRNVARAREAIDADRPLDTLNGPKTASFARNILGDTEAVTIDVWAARVALGDAADDDKILDRVGVYGAVAHAYRLAARRLGVEPSTAQAVTWVVARNGRAG